MTAKICTQPLQVFGLHQRQIQKPMPMQNSRRAEAAPCSVSSLPDFESAAQNGQNHQGQTEKNVIRPD